MNKLTRGILETKLPVVFTTEDLKRLEPDDNVRYLQMQRAMKCGDIIKLQRGMYILNGIFRNEPLNEFFVANQLDVDSYISLESALWLAGWIPAYIDEITSVTGRCSSYVKTPAGRFSYARIPQENLFAGVQEVFFGLLFHRQAKPLKALADYVYARRDQPVSPDCPVDTLQIEPEFLETLTAADFDEIQGNYVSAPFVDAFLDALRKELHI
jgi:hypothetical protein